MSGETEWPALEMTEFRLVCSGRGGVAVALSARQPRPLHLSPHLINGSLQNSPKAFLPSDLHVGWVV